MVAGKQKAMAMARAAQTCDFGWKARDFRLPTTDGGDYALADLRGERGTVIVFICNHCPYVRSIIDGIVREASELAVLVLRPKRLIPGEGRKRLEKTQRQQKLN
jgi:hypothetical protein